MVREGTNLTVYGVNLEDRTVVVVADDGCKYTLNIQEGDDGIFQDDDDTEWGEDEELPADNSIVVSEGMADYNRE